MNSRVLAVVLMMVGAGRLLAATTVYVDKSADPALADGTAEHPYVTIQKGVDEVEAGGTVYVLPGVYDEGETVDTDTSSNRVYITKKLTLVASSFEETGCRTNTIIRGKAATEVLSPVKDLGLGNGAVRCVRATVAGVIIRGFTLEEGHAKYDNNGNGSNQNLGGGVYGNADRGTRLEDCIIRNCAARSGGAVYFCRVVRCLITGCNSSNVGVCFRSSDIYNSIIARNGFLGGTGIGAYASAIYNSTLVENHTGVWQDSGAACYNCAIFRTALGSIKDRGFYSCVTDNDWAGYTHDENCRTATYESCLYSPLENDFRVVAGSDLDGTGDVANAQLTNGGAFDFFGNARKTSDTTMNIGAVEAARAVADDENVFAPSFVSTYAGATWANGAQQAVFGPVILGSKASFQRERTAEVPYPSVIRLSLRKRTDLGYVMASAGDGAESHTVLIGWDDTVSLPRLPRVGDADTSYGLRTASHLLYVDRGSRGSDTTGDGSAENPYQSLQKAATVASGYASGHCVVYVLPGDYDNETGTPDPAASCGSLKCRVALTSQQQSDVRFVAVGGPSVTTIRGEADATETGRGPDAVRCVFARTVNSSYGVYFTGFTLADGSTDAGTAADGRGGAAYGGVSASRLWLSDCVVTGCEAANGLLYYARAVRCQFVHCVTNDGALAVEGILASSLAWDCGPKGKTSSNYLIGAETLAYNVSIGSSSAKGCVSVATVRNSVLDQRHGVAEDINGYGIANNGTHKYTLARTVGGSPNTGIGGRQEGSLFYVPAGYADADNGDLRLVVTSQARGLAKFDQMWKGCPTDAFGVPFKGDADGRFTAGAVETTVPGASFTTTYKDGVSPTEPTVFDADGEIAVTSTALNRPLLGYDVNGELVATTNRSWTLRQTDYPGVDAFVVTAVYGTNFWADAVNGKETNSGLYEDDAKKYINSAIDLTEPGDVVIALPGTYDAPEEARLHVEGATIKSRVVIPANRTLRSRDGAETAIIAGAPSPTPTRLNRLGPDAIRCVYLDANAAIEGFTLTDGNTDAPATGSEDSQVNRRGGGVLAANATTSEIRDCIITNCASVRGGGVSKGVCRRCRIVGNTGTYMGTGCNATSLYRCFADHNTGNQMWLYEGSLEACTVGAHNYQSGTTRAEIYLQTKNSSTYIHNTVVLGGKVTCLASNIYDSVFASGVTVDGLATDHRCLLDAAPLGFEADGMTPTIGANVAIGRGNADWMTADDRDHDLLGSPHIWNGTLDAGAVEADWRDHYAQTLSGNKLTVDDAPASAVEQTASRQVRLVEGSLEMSWRARAHGPVPMTLNYAVPGTGTLSVFLNGERIDTVTAGQSGQYAYNNPSETDKLSFAYEPGANDALGALIGRFPSAIGMLMIVR